MADSNKKFQPRQILTGLFILGFLASLLLSNILLPQKQALAQNATLPQQIIGYIEDLINWAADYSIQEIQEAYQEIISNIQQWTKSDILEQRALKDAWNQTRAELLQELSNDVIKWAQGEGGNTNFVSDWPGYISDKTQTAGQNFLDNTLDKTTMCNSFGQNVKNDVRQINDSLDGKTFQQESGCPVTNMDEFMNGDFSWGTWLAALQTSGNYYGRLFSSLDALEAEKQLAYEQETAKLTANQGFKGEGDKTPGIIQSYAMQRASMMDFDYLLNSQDVNEYLSSVVDAFINRIINEGVKDMKTSDYEPKCQDQSGTEYEYDQATKTCKPKTEVSKQTNDISGVKTSKEYIEKFEDLLPLIKENLKKLRETQDKNLEIMNQIKALQDCANPDTPDNQPYANIATIDIRPAIETLEEKIKNASSSLKYVDQAIQHRDELMLAAEGVILADKEQDQQLITPALADYAAALQEFANKDGTGSLQKTLSPDPLQLEKEIDLRRLYSDASNFSKDTVKQNGDLIKERGVNKPSLLKQLKKYGVEGELSDTLYGQCYLERQKNQCAPPCT